jgi:hypothetical protein
MDTKQWIQSRGSENENDWEVLVIAIILIITGLTLFGGDWAGILSLERIQNLWPVALIAVGAAELVAGRFNRAR